MIKPYLRANLTQQIEAERWSSSTLTYGDFTTPLHLNPRLQNPKLWSMLLWTLITLNTKESTLLTGSTPVTKGSLLLTRQEQTTWAHNASHRSRASALPLLLSLSCYLMSLSPHTTETPPTSPFFFLHCPVANGLRVARKKKLFSFLLERILPFKQSAEIFPSDTWVETINSKLEPSVQ